MQIFAHLRDIVPDTKTCPAEAIFHLHAKISFETFQVLQSIRNIQTYIVCIYLHVNTSIYFNCVLIVMMFCVRNDSILTYMFWKFHHPVYSNPSFIWTTRVFSWECWEEGESDIGEGRLWREKNAKYWKILEGRKHMTRRTTNTTVYISFSKAILRSNVILQILVTVTAVLSVITFLHGELSLGSWSAWTVR